MVWLPTRRASPEVGVVSQLRSTQQCPVNQSGGYLGVLEPRRAEFLEGCSATRFPTQRGPDGSTRSALASVLFCALGLPTRYDPAVRCTIRGVVVLQFEGLTRIVLVALAAAVLEFDEQTIAHDRHGMDLTADIAWRLG